MYTPRELTDSDLKYLQFIEPFVTNYFVKTRKSEGGFDVQHNGKILLVIVFDSLFDNPGKKIIFQKEYELPSDSDVINFGKLSGIIESDFINV